MNSINRPHMMMQRSESEVEMNGQQPRPQSPATSGASPGIKRVRLENGQYEQIGPNGRGQPQNPHPVDSRQTAQQAQQLLLAHGINPGQLTTQQFQMFQNQPQPQQQKSIAMYAASMQQAQKGQQMAAMQAGKAMGQNMGQAGSPMMPQTSDGAIGGGLSEFYQPGPGTNMRGGGMAAGGNIALQDYQMQLILLEQQNKKRLMMARAEQDHLASGGEANRPGFPQGMSPNSRANPSPGPGGKPQMAGTPKMQNQGGPGSPVPDGQMPGHIQQRSSPASAAGFNGQMPEGQHMMYKPMENMAMLSGGAGAGGVPNGNMMRPPNFNGPMGQPGMEGQGMNPNMVRPPQGGRGHPAAAGMWQQQPGAQMQPGQAPPNQQPGGPQQAQTPQQTGTPQQTRQNIPHGNMPPPQAPPNPGPNRGGAPASPQVSTQQPPTPTQGGKAAAGKKAAATKAQKVSAPNSSISVISKPKQRGSQAKKGGAGAGGPNAPPSAVTPTATSEPPTPTTPQHSANFPARPNQNFNPNAPTPGTGSTPGPNNANPNNGNGAPPTAPGAPSGPPQNSQQQPQQQAMDQGVNSAFMDMDTGVNFDNTFSGVGGEDSLLDGFDFDSFLTNGDDNGGLPGFAPDGLAWTGDGVEAGAGDS